MFFSNFTKHLFLLSVFLFQTNLFTYILPKKIIVLISLGIQKENWTNFIILSNKFFLLLITLYLLYFFYKKLNLFYHSDDNHFKIQKGKLFFSKIYKPKIDEILGKDTTSLEEKFNQKEYTSLKKNSSEILENELQILTHQKEKIKALKDIKTELNEVLSSKDLDKLNNVKENINVIIEDSYTKENVVLGRIESHYLDLYHKLKKMHPNLSKTDIRHCILVKNDFSLKESAEMLSVTINTVKKGRSRAKNKIDITPNTLLREYLNTI